MDLNNYIFNIQLKDSRGKVAYNLITCQKLKRSISILKNGFRMIDVKIIRMIRILATLRIQ